MTKQTNPIAARDAGRASPFRGEHFGAFSSNGGATWYCAGIDSSGSHHQMRGTLTREQASEWARQKDSVYASALKNGGDKIAGMSAEDCADYDASQIDCPEIA